MVSVRSDSVVSIIGERGCDFTKYFEKRSRSAICQNVFTYIHNGYDSLFICLNFLRECHGFFAII